jgi:hypothetical protein
MATIVGRLFAYARGIHVHCQPVHCTSREPLFDDCAWEVGLSEKCP